MSNAERIVRTLDGHLDHPVRLVLHGRAATDVFVRSDWEREIAPVELAGLRWLRLFRPATVNLVLTKLMRGDDAQDMADTASLIRDGRITPAQLVAAFATTQIPDLVELRDAFKCAQPLVMKIAEDNRK